MQARNQVRAMFPSSLPLDFQTGLQALAVEMATAGVDPMAIDDEYLHIIDESLDILVRTTDWLGVIWLRNLFNPLIRRDTAIGIPQIRRIEQQALIAARQIGDPAIQAPLLEEEARHLHKQGYHDRAIECFQAASRAYSSSGQESLATRSYFMTATCQRALGRSRVSEAIIQTILEQTDKSDPFRGELLHALALLRRDEGNLDEAEQLLHQSLDYYQLIDRNARINSSDYHLIDPSSLVGVFDEGADVLVAGALTDLGEIRGLRGDKRGAKMLFQSSLDLLAEYRGQFKRHEARTRLKLVEVLAFEGDYDEALRLLHSTSDELCAWDEQPQAARLYYDWLWRTELLEAFIYFRMGHVGLMLRKLRLVLAYRSELSLSLPHLIRQLFGRLRSSLLNNVMRRETSAETDAA